MLILSNSRPIGKLVDRFTMSVYLVFGLQLQIRGTIKIKLVHLKKSNNYPTNFKVTRADGEEKRLLRNNGRGSKAPFFYFFKNERIIIVFGDEHN